jgi:hypothetical protein
MALKDDLVKIAGAAAVADDAETLARHGSDFSTTKPGPFSCVVRPQTVAQVQAIIKLAGEQKFAVVPQSSRVHFHGAAVPKQAGVVLDLSGMDKIVELVEEPLVAYLQAGVTWEQYTAALDEKGYTPVIPLLPHAERSVISDYLEREQPTLQAHESADPLQSLQMVWGNGEEFVSGSASIGNFRSGSLSDGVLPTGPGPMSYDTFFYGAQGTVGVVTWGVTSYEVKPTLSKAWFIPADDPQALVEPMYKILRAGVTCEHLLLNNINLATILAENWPEDFDQLRAALPPWTLIMVVRALKYRPEEKLAYCNEAIQEIMRRDFRELDLLETIPGVPAAERKLCEMLRKPWPKERPYWKHALRGSSEDLPMITTLERINWYIPAVMDVAAEAGYSGSDVGVYVQPLHDGHACEITFSFPYDPNDEMEMALIREMYRAAASTVMENGAYITRPYPIIADLVYRRHADQVAFLQRFKKYFDPNGVMSPGNLCF